MANIIEPPETATGTNSSAANIATKRTYGQRWGVAPRTIDGWLAKGLPHLKISERMVRIDIPEADAWLKEKFSTRRAK